MKVQVIGKSCGTFEDKDTGKPVGYGTIHCLGPFPRNRTDVTGQMCKVIKCGFDIAESLDVPCDVDLDLDEQGHLLGVEIL